MDQDPVYQAGCQSRSTVARGCDIPGCPRSRPRGPGQSDRPAARLIAAIACYYDRPLHEKPRPNRKLASREAKPPRTRLFSRRCLLRSLWRRVRWPSRWRQARHRSPTAITKSRLPQVSATSQKENEIMNETQMTLVGNLVEDPELRFTPSWPAGRQVPHRQHPRYKDKQRTSGRTATACSSPSPCGARRLRTSREPDPRHARHRDRAAQAAVV